MTGNRQTLLSLSVLCVLSSTPVASVSEQLHFPDGPTETNALFYTEAQHHVDARANWNELWEYVHFTLSLPSRCVLTYLHAYINPETHA